MPTSTPVIATATPTQLPTATVTPVSPTIVPALTSTATIVPPTATATPVATTIPTTATSTPTSTRTATPTPTATQTSAPGQVTWGTVRSWVYQLNNYQNDRLDQIAGSHFDLVVVDLTRNGAADYFNRSEVAAVKATGKFALAYFEIGAIEDYRPEWSQVPNDLMLGPVAGWPSEQYVKYWDERWWPIVKGRIDQAIAAGFDGAYLDMIVTYEEIPANAAGTNRADLAGKMVDLIARLAQYAKGVAPGFKIVPQNAPELYTWPKYLPNTDGLGMEEMYFQATDTACNESWCAENRANAQAIHAAGKLVLHHRLRRPRRQYRQRLHPGAGGRLRAVCIGRQPRCDARQPRLGPLIPEPHLSGRGPQPWPKYLVSPPVAASLADRNPES